MKTQTQGRHIGELPTNAAHLAEMRRAHALGHTTIDATTYRVLITAGIEPDRFTAMPEAEISAVVGRYVPPEPLVDTEPLVECSLV